MNMRSRLALLVAATFIGLSANAQVTVIGNSIGKECYEAALLDLSPTTSDERSCTHAINSGALDERNLTATYVNRGILRMRMSNYQGALADYRIAKERRPNLGAIYVNEGAALIGLGDAQGALVALNRALELDTRDAHAAHYNLGLAHEKLGNPTEAYFSYRKALELRPGWELPERELTRFTVRGEDS